MSRLTQIDGLPIIDAKRPIRIRITKGDIAEAADSIKEPSGCAVARACVRELHVKEARIHLSSIYLRTNDHNWVRYQTPNRLRSEIIAFDRGGMFEPTEATLYPRPDSKRHGHNTSSNKSTGKRRERRLTIANVRNGPA